MGKIAIQILIVLVQSFFHASRCRLCNFIQSHENNIFFYLRIQKTQFNYSTNLILHRSNLIALVINFHNHNNSHILLNTIIFITIYIPHYNNRYNNFTQ